MSEKPSGGKSTSTTQCAGMGARDGFREGAGEVFSCRRVPPQNEDGISIPRLPLARMSKMLPARSRQKHSQTETPKILYQATMKRTRFLREAGYQVIEAWACEVGKILKGNRRGLKQKATRTRSCTISRRMAIIIIGRSRRPRSR